jgi:hypothetical protein
VKDVLKRYFDGHFELVEARGWKSVPTKRDFHGWHADAWYDEKAVQGIPKEVKLCFYLTDVFNYLRGSHRKYHPRIYRNDELAGMDRSRVLEVTGPAGLAFLFDTTGIHRQGVPILEPRQAVFYNYHDPAVKLEDGNVYNRYHPLLLNAGFLGGLSAEDYTILGFGNKTNYVPAFERPAAHTLLQKAFSAAHDASLRLTDLRARVAARTGRLFGRAAR